MPSKLYQYLNAGRFTIYGGGEQDFNTLAGFLHNIVIPPDNIDELVTAIKTAEKLCSKSLDFEHNIVKIGETYVREENILKVLQQWTQ